MSGRSRLALGAVSALVLAGCAVDPVGPDTLDGLYVLETINGDPLPFVLSETASRTVELAAGQIELFEDGTCRDMVTYRITEDAEPTAESFENDCTWTLADAALRIIYESSIASGSIVAGTITLVADTRIFLFRK